LRLRQVVEGVTTAAGPRRKRWRSGSRGESILLLLDRYLVWVSAGLVAGIWLVSDWVGLPMSEGAKGALATFVGYAAIKGRTDGRWRQRFGSAGMRPYGPHRVRHSRLTHLAERGLPLRALQHLARHARERTTETYYLHVNKLKMAELAVEELASMTPPLPPPPGNGEDTAGKALPIALVA
jgi:integrase